MRTVKHEDGLLVAAFENIFLESLMHKRDIPFVDNFRWPLLKPWGCTRQAPQFYIVGFNLTNIWVSICMVTLGIAMTKFMPSFPAVTVSLLQWFPSQWMTLPTTQLPSQKPMNNLWPLILPHPLLSVNAQSLSFCLQKHLWNLSTSQSPILVVVTSISHVDYCNSPNDLPAAKLGLLQCISHAWSFWHVNLKAFYSPT